MKPYWFYAAALLFFASCTGNPKTDTYPAAVLDEPSRGGQTEEPGTAEEAAESPETALQEEPRYEDDFFDAELERQKLFLFPEKREETGMAETGETETGDEAVPDLAETFVPEPPPEEENPVSEPSPPELAAEPEPVQPESPPELAAVPPVEQEAPVQETLPEPQPDPPPQALRPAEPDSPPGPPQVVRPAPPPRPNPPPVPAFIRPSEPFIPAEDTAEIPRAEIPVLPSRQYPPAEESPRYSRTVSAFRGQYIEIPFRGPGWVYLGELGSRRGVYYASRRVDDEGMTFVFRADEEGSYSLGFDRQDFVHDTTLKDYVRITVHSLPETSGSAWNSVTTAPDRVYAGPRWPPPTGAAVSAPEPNAWAESQQQNAAPLNGSAAGTVSRQDPAPAPNAPSTPGAYLAKAREDYDAGRIAGALDALDKFSAADPDGSDEAYWLYGQALEANSPSRDIRLALDYYRRLTREYPQSDRYDAARRRAAYLERFYFNIQ